jgi:hypothetical protein
MKQPLLTKKYITDGLLIVFSVLFALFINKTFESISRNKEKKLALESIKQEIKRNDKILGEWIEKHGAIVKKISKVAQNDSLKTIVGKGPILDFQVLTGQENIYDAFLTNTAWETAKSTGILSEFDYKIIEKLTEVYTTQEIMTERTLVSVVELFHSRETHDFKQLDQTIIQFQLRFMELNGQEGYLKTKYAEALEIMD